MINFIVNGNLDLSEKVQSYQLNTTYVKSGNSFIDVSGNEISKSIGKNQAAKFKLVDLTEEQRQNLSTILDSGKMEVTGTGLDGEYTVDSNYNFNFVRRPKLTWEADFTINKFVAASGGDSL